MPSSGQIQLENQNAIGDLSLVQNKIGYCPQMNTLVDTMTVWEHMLFFAMIKGVPKREQVELVETMIDQLGLSMFSNRESSTLSGGNKRKLQVAIAILACPPVVLLDEPSAGMDPEARRFMWRVVSRLTNAGTSAIVLTTHSMDEAEALSCKLGIMVQGGLFKCFGPAQHIKNKFGRGFILDLKATKEGLLETLCHKFNKFELLESLGLYHKVRLDDFSLAQIFETVQGLKTEGLVSEYSVQ